MNDNNPLLDFSGLPRFAGIRPEHVTPAVDPLLSVARATVESVASDSATPSWDSVVEPMADALKRAAGDAKDPVLIINADGQATHQSVVRVMEAARLAGLVHITFATQATPAGK